MNYNSPFTAIRNCGTNRSGGSFDPTVVEAVWRKGQVVAGNDPAVFRKDACGAWMKRSDYGNTESQYGWEVDHIVPVARGGADDYSNLQPLQWQNNRGKSDDYPRYACAVSAT
jgi:hypothetical protein